jgi:hypothetical protein
MTATKRVEVQDASLAEVIRRFATVARLSKRAVAP